MYIGIEKFLLNLYNNRLPSTIKSVIKHLNSYPSIYYTGRALATCGERLSKSHQPRYQIDKARLIKDFQDYEALFQDSERNFEAIMGPYTSEFRWFLGRIYNTWFVSVDAELYYSMIRSYRPNLIIEIGSGHSTHFGMDAVNVNQTGRMISIDPAPRIKLPKGVAHIQAKVQEVDVDVFTELREGDILFIDSSHTTEEALYHCEQILPNIHSGVIIHHHDFYWPYRAYHEDDPITYGEPDVVLRFYSDNRESFEVIACASYVRYKNLELVNRLVRSYKWNLRKIPGSLWTKTKKP
jgi:hypothetical protein